MLSEHDFEYLREVVRRVAGVRIEPVQLPMVEARLTTVSRALGYEESNRLLAEVRSPGANGLLTQMVEALLNNETSFFRDITFYRALEQHVLPPLIERRRRIRTLNIWSAACSTGQEPYSVLMLLRSRFAAQLAGWNVYILATDLSRQNLDVARAGTYRQFQINRGLPAEMLVHNFEHRGEEWQVKADLREQVEFARLNLLEEWAAMPPFDLILLRNVLLYFSEEHRQQVLARAEGQLREHGVLALGGGEIFTGHHELRPETQGRWVFYRRKTPTGELPELPNITWPKESAES